MASIAVEKPKRGGLSLTNKLAFGVGDLGAAINAGVNGFYLIAFLYDVARLSPASVGLIFFIAQFWDAVNDPLIGTLSDKTHSRFGRRRSWILFGAIPFGIAFLMHWFVPALDSNGLFWYYLVVAILLRTASTAVNVPYTAMTPEMTEDYDERTQLNTFRFAFSILGALVAIVAQPFIVSSLGGDNSAYFISAGIWAVFIVLSSFLCVAGTFELPHQEQAKVEETVSKNQSSSLIGGLLNIPRLIINELYLLLWFALKSIQDFLVHYTPYKGFASFDKHRPEESAILRYFQYLTSVFNNRPFLIVTGIYLLSWLTLQFVQQFLLLYTRYWLDAEANFQFYVLALQVTAFLFLSVWTAVSARIGKKLTYVAGASIWIVAMAALFFIQKGQDVWVYVIAIFAGMGVSTAYLIPWSMLPDVVDYDELQTGQRREGTFYGLFALLQQIGISFGVAIGSWALGSAGYLAPVTGEIATQPDSVLFALRAIVSIAPVVMLALSIPLAMAYPISRERHTEIMQQLEKNRAVATNNTITT